jgi:sugar lactone lactonase YvrE
MKKYILGLFLITCSLSVLKAQVIQTVAGDGVVGFFGDGDTATAAELHFPFGVAVDDSGNFYIADEGNNRIRKVNTAGRISTYAGNGTAGYSGDGGDATLAELHFPTGVAVDDSGNVYIADEGNNRIRKVNKAGTMSTVAGNGTKGYSGDGNAATAAQLNSPFGIAVDTAHNIYIADNSNHCIRMVNTSGTIYTIAGIGSGGFSGDGGPATGAELYYPTGVTVDGSGNVYIADNANNRVREVNAVTGTINTIAGNGIAGYRGDTCLADTTRLSSPKGVAVDGLGNVYIADEGNSRIRMVTSSGYIYTVVGDSVPGYSGDGGLADTAKIWMPFGVALDYFSGNIYIADEGNNRVRRVGGLVTGVQDLKVESEKLKVFPNPSDGKFTIESSVNSRQSIEIYNMLGEKVYAASLNPSNETLISLPIGEGRGGAGVYFYRVISGNGTFIGSGKLVIQK